MEPFRRAQPAPRLERILPIARDLRRYRGGGARNDVLAGLTVAALAIPSGMAYAQLAGLTPVIGRIFAPTLPAALVIVVGGIACSELLNLAQHGVATVGAVPAGLPTPSLPRPEDWLALAPAAAGIFLVDFADDVLTARSYAARRGDHIDVGVRRSARPRDAVLGWDAELGRYADVLERPEAVTTPGVVVYRLGDRLFYANVSYVTARVLEAVRGAPAPPPVLLTHAG